MAIVRYPKTGVSIHQMPQVATACAECGIIYERWGIERLPPQLAARDLSDGEKQMLLTAFSPEITRLKHERGYQAADVVTLYPETPNLDMLLAKFDKRHTHADDEVRFIVQGSGIFTLCPQSGPQQGNIVEIEVHPGDFLTVPANYQHWFTLTSERRITAIRIFTDPAGWVANYV